MNINGGNTTKKAKRANIRPLSSENQPRKRAVLPHKIIAKNGIVMDRTSSIACQIHKYHSGYIEGNAENIDVFVAWLIVQKGGLLRTIARDPTKNLCQSPRWWAAA